jgi:PST family polysaccharide transporter
LIFEQLDSKWLSILPAFIKNRIKGRHNLQKILGNTCWLFSDKILRMGVGLTVGVWVARYLGPEQFGLLSYAGAYVALFSALATLGLDGIVVREIVKNPQNRDEILGTAFVLKMVGGIVILLLTVSSVMLLHHGDTLVAWVVGIVAVGTIFQMFDVIDFWFQSQVAAKYVVWARNCSFFILSSCKIILIKLHSPLLMFALAGLFEILLGAIGLVIVYHRYGQKIGAWHWNRSRAGSLLKDSWPMIISGVSIAVYMKIDQVMLAQILDTTAVGVYSAAVGISEIWYFIPMAIVSSVFPSFIQARIGDESLYYQRIQKLFSLMTVLSLSIALPMTFLSSSLIKIFFGDSYSAAGPVLAIHIWTSLFVFLGVAQSPWDLTENLTRLALFRMASGAILNIILNIFMIPAYGVVGAALATVISQAFASVILNAVHEKTKRIFNLQIKAMFFLQDIRN